MSLEYALDIYEFVKGPDDYLYMPDKYKDVKTPKANLNLYPFYAFCFADRYTGYDPLPPSSYTFYLKMAKLVNMVNIPIHSNEIIDLISKVAPYFYKHRNLQNIDALKIPNDNKSQNIFKYYFWNLVYKIIKKI